MRPKCMLWTAPSLLHTVSQRPVSAPLMRENRSHNDVSAAVVFMQHNALTTAIHIVFADTDFFFHFEFPKKNLYVCVCVCENVKMCVHWEVREWQRGSSLAPAFLSSAVGRAISADSVWDVAGARGLRGF